MLFKKLYKPCNSFGVFALCHIEHPFSIQIHEYGDILMPTFTCLVDSDGSHVRKIKVFLSNLYPVLNDSP